LKEIIRLKSLKASLIVGFSNFSAKFFSFRNNAVYWKGRGLTKHWMRRKVFHKHILGG